MHVHAPGCGCKGLHANASLRRDPTRTIYIRARYEADLVRRFTRLKRQIITAVGTENGFGLQANQDAVAPPRFNFPRSADKVDAFMTWLEDQEYAGILETTRGTPLALGRATPWQNVYINSAYQKGIAQAAGLMRGDGVDVSDRWIDAGFLRPIHADAVGLIHTRAYNELQGITDVMDQQILAHAGAGIGRGPRVRWISPARWWTAWTPSASHGLACSRARRRLRPTPIARSTLTMRPGLRACPSCLSSQRPATIRYALSAQPSRGGASIRLTRPAASSPASELPLRLAPDSQKSAWNSAALKAHLFNEY